MTIGRYVAISNKHDNDGKDNEKNRNSIIVTHFKTPTRLPKGKSALFLNWKNTKFLT